MTKLWNPGLAIKLIVLFVGFAILDAIIGGLIQDHWAKVSDELISRLGTLVAAYFVLR